MVDRAHFRLRDIIDAIDQIDLLLAGATFGDLLANRMQRAAFERFLEILSEASRHIPENMKAAESTIPWRRVSDIGNHLRHAYHRVDAEILWRIWADGDLALLRDAVSRQIAAMTKAAP